MAINIEMQIILYNQSPATITATRIQGVIKAGNCLESYHNFIAIQSVALTPGLQNIRKKICDRFEFFMY